MKNVCLFVLVLGFSYITYAGAATPHQEFLELCSSEDKSVVAMSDRQERFIPTFVEMLNQDDFLRVEFLNVSLHQFSRDQQETLYKAILEGKFPHLKSLDLGRTEITTDSYQRLAGAIRTGLLDKVVLLDFPPTINQTNAGLLREAFFAVQNEFTLGRNNQVDDILNGLMQSGHLCLIKNHERLITVIESAAQAATRFGEQAAQRARRAFSR